MSILLQEWLDVNEIKLGKIEYIKSTLPQNPFMKMLISNEIEEEVFSCGNVKWHFCEDYIRLGDDWIDPLEKRYGYDVSEKIRRLG